MTTFTVISSGSLAVGKPLTSAIALALRDNPIAIAEGDVGAPRLKLGALERLTVGTVVKSRADGASNAAVSGVTVSAHVFGFMQAGTVRCTASHQISVSDNSSTLDISRTRSGVKTILGTWSTTSTSPVARSVDIPIVPGDTIQFEHSASGARTSTVTLARIQTNGEELFPGPTYATMESAVV